MSKIALKIENFTAEELEGLIQKDDKFRQAVRLFACLQVARGKRPKELEDFYQTSFKTICNWIHRLNEDGPDGLVDKPKPGRPKGLDDWQLERIREVTLNHSPEEFKLNSSTWTAPLLALWIQSEFGVSYKKAQIYNILHSLGLSFQKGKGFYPEAVDRDEAIAALKKT